MPPKPGQEVSGTTDFRGGAWNEKFGVPELGDFRQGVVQYAMTIIIKR